MPGRLGGAGGFTLVELVAVIVLLGVVAVASTQFIGQAVGIYSDSSRRDALQQQARFVTERISRELRNALPGSVRVAANAGNTVQCLEFVPLITASSYLQTVADVPISSVEIVDVGYSFSTGDKLAIYPIDETSVYQSPSAIRLLTAVGVAGPGKQLLNFSAYQFPSESPTRRAFIVNGPVSVCASDGQINRYSGYSLAATQAVPPAASAVLLAEAIRLNDSGPVTVFEYSNGTLQRSAVVNMDLRFQSEDEWLRFSQQVFVRNTP